MVDTGALVAFPTETVYGIACRVKTDSLNKLEKIKNRGSDKPYTLHIGQKADVKKYLPTIGLQAQKLIKKAWPGPLTIVFELPDLEIEKIKSNLDSEVFDNLYKENSIGIRCPDDPVATKLLQTAKTPVVAPSANITNQPPATDATGVLNQLSGQIDLILDAGPCKHKKSSTVVKIGNKGLEILRPGVYSKQELQAFSNIKFLFVCTGNTCRSPMAEAMFRKYWAEKIDCELDQLDKKGYKVTSAGTMGIAGVPASAEAIALCAAKGINLKDHKSSALTQQLIEESDFIFVMSQMHHQRVVDLSPEAVEKCMLLAKGQDIPDPIGQSQQVYQSCAKTIEEAIRKRINKFVV